MGKNQGSQTTEYDFDQLLRSPFGLSDDQLLEMMQLAEETVDDSQIPPTPADGFERMVAELERRRNASQPVDSDSEKEGGVCAEEKTTEETIMADEIEAEETKAEEIKPNKLTTENVIDGDGETGEKKRKVRLLGPLIKVAIAVAILASILVFTSIQVGAKRSYDYEKRTRENVRNDVAMNNEINMQREGNLSSAYEQIYNKLGIRVLTLGFKPEKLWYIETAVSDRHATMYFDYNGKRFYILQQIRTEENSSNIMSDRKAYDSVYNGWLDMDIEIERATTENNEVEFSAQFTQYDVYYYLAGIMDENDFKAIIEDLKYNE